MQSIKKTFNIDADLDNEIKILINQNIVESMTSAINQALAQYIKDIKKQEYYRSMKEASKDDEFIKRTLNCQKQFDKIDTEIGKEW